MAEPAAGVQGQPPIPWRAPFMRPGEVVAEGTNEPIEQRLTLHRLTPPPRYRYAEADFSKPDHVALIVDFLIRVYHQGYEIQTIADEKLVKWAIQRFWGAYNPDGYTVGPNVCVFRPDGYICAFYGAMILGVQINGSQTMRWALATFKAYDRTHFPNEATLLRDLMFKSFFRHCKQVAFATSTIYDMQPMATLTVYYRLLNVDLFEEEQFEPFLHAFQRQNETTPQLLERVRTENSRVFLSPGWREMNIDDMPQVFRMLVDRNRECRYKLIPSFARQDDLTRLLLPNMDIPHCVKSYVYETRTAGLARKRTLQHEVVGFATFYMTLTGCNDDSFVKAHLYYHCPAPNTLQFYKDLFPLARRARGDVFVSTGACNVWAYANDIGLVDIGEKVHYCVTNWRCPPLLESEVGLLLL